MASVLEKQEEENIGKQLQMETKSFDKAERGEK
eukprot:CAMPEP_0113540294 /NCGR_PEP_ID=MMETSP0015_2-20120614/8399_1 /TAXON_ID=2838 /ORGANISM="Odontella" /LENGTH=32 /DNA_ID=CAMNT_0000440079 /DNA_START=282 /DNA_END=380 /DNA_ORIENTATION=+ /assembly_acc=CAM_ASM_000160